MAAALTLAVVLLAPQGRRWAAAGWWFVPALAGGGFWYLRNLVVAGNPIPEVHSLGPISLPHPDRLQEGRPDFNIVHYATDTGVWRDYFGPGLHEAFGVLWPLVVFGAALAALVAVLRGRDRIVRWIGAVALFGLLAYLFTPLSAAGAEGEPVGFGINIRYVIPALLAGIVLLPLDRSLDREKRQWWLLGALVLVFLVTNRPDDALHDKARVFAFLLVVLAVLLPALLLHLRGRGVGVAALAGAAAGLVVLLVAIGYPVQRHYLENRFANDGLADERIPGMHLDSAYRWARGVEDARIGLAGTTAGFAGYGFAGTDLSNRVRYLGEDGPHGGFNAIPTCAGFRAAVNAADLDYLVTSPFLNFLHPGNPVASPEARWLRGEDAVSPVLRSGPVTVWKVEGDLTPEPAARPTRPCAKFRRPLRLDCLLRLLGNLARWRIQSRTRSSSGRRDGGPCRRSTTRASDASPTESSTRSAKNCGAGSARPSPLPNSPISTGRAPTGRSRLLSTSPPRSRAIPRPSPMRPSGCTCAEPPTSPAAGSCRSSYSSESSDSSPPSPFSAAPARRMTIWSASMRTVTSRFPAQCSV